MAYRIRTAPPHRGSALLALAGICLLGLAVSAPRAAAAVVVDPGVAADGQNVSTFYAGQGITLSTNGADPNVYADLSDPPSPGFAWMDAGYIDSHWGRAESPNFQAGFNFLADSVSLEVFTDAGATIQAFDPANNPVGTTLFVPINGRQGNNQYLRRGPMNGLMDGQLSISDPNGQIARVVVSMVKMPGSDFGHIGAMTVVPAGTAPIPEPSTLALLAGGALPLLGLFFRKNNR